MAGKKRKIKSKKDSPLGILDYLIYFIAIIVSIVIALSPYILAANIQSSVAFSDTGVIAVDRDNPSILFLLPLLMFLLISVLGSTLFIIGKECPIIGKIKFAREANHFKNDFIPNVKSLLQEVCDWFKKGKNGTICILFLLISLCMTPLAIFCRTTLNDEFIIEKYDIFNQKTGSYTVEDYDKLIVQVYDSRGKGGTTYGYAIEIVFDNGDSAYINNYNFKSQNDTIDYSLNRMLEIKSLFDAESIIIEEYDKIDRVIQHLNLSESQTDKLYRLFSTP